MIPEPKIQPQWGCRSCFAAAERTGPIPPPVFPDHCDWRAPIEWCLCLQCAAIEGQRTIVLKLTPEESYQFKRFIEESSELYTMSLTAELIVQNFVSDFLGSARGNGSGERVYARRWFNRTPLAWPKDQRIFLI